LKQCLEQCLAHACSNAWSMLEASSAKDFLI
jgi:hypothetical protein